MFIRKFWQRKAIKSYISKLPACLKKDYGSSKSYTIGQVRSSIERHGLNRTYAVYAYAIFMQEDDFLALDGDSGLSYETVRQEVADSYFHGNNDFSVSDSGVNSFSGSDSSLGDCD